MHDGLSVTLLGTILRHGGEAPDAVRAARQLDERGLKQLLTFLQTL